ncbi:MAG: hypothetical protein AAF404_03585 [Pseudomonadota bacterium]
MVSTIYGEVHMLSRLTGACVHKQAEALPSAMRSVEGYNKNSKISS